MHHCKTRHLTGKLVSVHAGGNEDLSKQRRDSVQVELDGFSNDKHRGYSRIAYAGDREAQGTELRNDRQWSGVSIEELAEISRKLDLSQSLAPETLGANLCIEGIPGFSLLPKGTRLKFPSGAVLVIEEYNPPCTDMGAQVAAKYTTNSGLPLDKKQFLKPASGRRGVVGVVDVPGMINSGDEVLVEVFEAPTIRLF